MQKRLIRVFAVAVAAASLGCKTEYGCLEIDGPCSSTGPVAADFIVGLSPLAVDQGPPVNAGGGRATMHVGEIVTLHLVHSATGDITSATDTVRAVSWSLTDSASARLVPQSDGSARLLAMKVGRVGIISANGWTNGPWACGLIGTARGCLSVGAVDVIAP